MTTKAQYEKELIDRLIREKLELKAQLAEVQKKQQIFLQCVKDMAEYDCYYGDNCPPFGTNHGQCDGCKAREALKEATNE